MTDIVDGGWEPVPYATQIVALPFVAGVEGLLNVDRKVSKLRVTLHRVVTREGQGYLQQACDYVGASETGVGRLFKTDDRMIGVAYRTKAVWRTKRFDTVEQLRDRIGPEAPLAYLVVPFISASDGVAAVLFAECDEFNFFADDLRVKAVVDICRGFCALVDRLGVKPPPEIRNFPFSPAKSTPTGGGPAFDVHEELKPLAPPKFSSIESLNFDLGPG
jgi:hypothetical protein